MIEIEYSDAQDVVDLALRMFLASGDTISDSFSLARLIAVAPSYWTISRLEDAVKEGLAVGVFNRFKNSNKIFIIPRIDAILQDYENYALSRPDMDLFAEIFGKDSSPIAENVQVVYV